MYTPEEGYKIASKKIKEARRSSTTELNLSGLGLTSLPPEIEQLTTLTLLNINNNQLKYLPVKIGNLVKLTSLYVGNNRVTSLCAEIGNLVELTSLGLSNNILTSLPAEIRLLTNLTSLNLAMNQFTVLPGEIGYLVNLTSLDIGRNQLRSLPVEIGMLVNLISLNLIKNELISLPTEIGKLVTLHSLNIGFNKLTSLPMEIGKLTNLDLLNLEHNKLTSLPAEIGQLVKLTSFSLANNQVKSLPVEIQNLKKLKEFSLQNNPMSIPPEILEKVKEPQVILNYYFPRIAKALNECKVLVVGQGSVGKTSLIHRLLENKFDPKENKTEGIDIRRFNFRAHDNTYNLNVWDFGGQEIMHATHQFFLTKRSLYLLVLDSRLTQEENRVEYWLKMIESFGGDSPVLVVGNKTDQHPLDIDRSGLQKKYPNIVGIFETSAATGKGMDGLRTAIAEQIHNLPHVRDLLPESWFMVKQQLEELGRDKNFIQRDEFLSLCSKNKVAEESSQRTLIGFMHDLGVVLHFQDDPRLEALGILNPQWVTNGVYKILNAHALFQARGVLTVSMLNEILNLPEYPRDKRLFIVDMMKKFELCYDITDTTFLVPDLLPKDEPFTGELNNALAFQYHYTVLPSSVITRFIVRMNEFIHKTVWRSGVVLKSGENTALVKADMEDKKIYIWVNGIENTRRDFLSAIRNQFDAIHKTITKLEVREKVPVPGQDNIVVDFQHLLKLEKMGEATYIPEGLEQRINIRQLLNGVESETDRQRVNMTNVYIGGDVKDSNLILGDENQVGRKK